MYPDLPDRFFDAIRNPPAITSRVEVWLGGARADDYGDDGLPFYGGQVDVDGGKQIRRTLTGLQVDADTDTWDLLSPPGTELRAWRGFRYPNGDTDEVPQGRFVIPNLEETYGGDWDGQIGSAPDRFDLVRKARFTTPRAIPAGVYIKDTIATLMSEVLGTVTNTCTSFAVTPSPLLYERDRAKAIQEMAASIGADVGVSADGTPYVRDAPVLASTPVWQVTVGDDGILYRATRGRSYERTYSGVVASAAQIDGALPFPPVTVWDTNPGSPTYHLGPFGKVPFFLTSPLLGTSAQASTAAETRLRDVTAIRNQLTVDAETNPALEDGDTITVTLPARDGFGSPIVERHLVKAFTVPLLPSGLQRIETVSSAADVEESP